MTRKPLTFDEYFRAVAAADAAAIARLPKAIEGFRVRVATLERRESTHAEDRKMAARANPGDYA